ncbi:hypothetical protein MMC10_007013 [Thelotrema lepadinum]|nr:hypothetical protein [Thelotrema lepadinum]
MVLDEQSQSPPDLPPDFDMCNNLRIDPQQLRVAVTRGDFAEAANLSHVLGLIDEIDEPNYGGDTALHVAVQTQQTGLVGLLLSRGANVNAKGASGRTALHYLFRSWNAFQSGIFRGLMEWRPRVSEPDYEGNTPLHLVLQLPSSPIIFTVVKQLVTGGAKVNQTNLAGRSSFHILVEDTVGDDLDWIFLIEMFLRHGADPHKGFGVTTILSKVFEGRSSQANVDMVMKVLLSYGVHPLCADSTRDLLMYTVYKQLRAVEDDAGPDSHRAKLASILKAMLRSFTGPPQVPTPPDIWWWERYQNLRRSIHDDRGIFSNFLLEDFRDLLSKATVLEKDNVDFFRLALGYVVDEWLEADWKSRKHLVDAAKTLDDLKNVMSNVVKWRRDVVEDCKSLGMRAEWNDYSHFKSAIDRLSEASESEHTYESLVNLEIASELRNFQLFLDQSKRKR